MPEATGTNPLRVLWTAGHDAVGTWCGLPAVAAAEVLARSGFEWVCVDWQHGLFGAESLSPLVAAVSSGGAVPVVRVPLNEPWMIQKALDLGAFGVMVPLVNDRADAERAAAACRYPPAGVRSYGPVQASALIGVEPEAANREVVCMVQIETREALERVAEIAATPGVDALFVGPADLALSLGVPLGSPDVDATLGAVLDAAREAGIPVGRHLDTPAQARAAFEAGFAFVALGSDLEFLAAAAVETASAARRQPPPARPSAAAAASRILVSSSPPDVGAAAS